MPYYENCMGLLSSVKISLLVKNLLIHPRKPEKRHESRQIILLPTVQIARVSPEKGKRNAFTASILLA